MIRITTILMMLAFTFVGYSQQEVVQDFESSPSVAGFEGLASAQIIADPTTGNNGNVFELVTNTGGNPWQGAEVNLADESVLDLTSDITISVDVYSTVAFSPMVKVESSQGAAAAANTQDHTGSGWETLTYNFNTGSDGTATADGIYTKVVFFPNRASDDAGWNTPPIDATVLFDNIVGVKTALGDEPVGNPPSTAAPTPPAREASSVISLFSNAYTNINVTEWSAPWDSAEIEDVVIDGDDTKKITFGGFLGVDFAANAFDATDMTHFHMDYWTDETDLDGKVFNPKWSNHMDGNGETNAYDLNNPIPSGSTGQWVSLDIPLTDFTPVNGADRSAFAQFLITSNLVGDAYVDNIYLHDNTTLSSDTFNQAEFKTYPNPTSDVWNVQTTENIQTIEIFNTVGKLVKEVTVNGNQAEINSADLSTGIYFARISNEFDQTKTIKLIKK
ncbi:T9SS type A sorting domain-containing protein [Psychroflexus planctonicus]|nr:T9SS type A sorting domain-containing protein [Psychroflexus planctonicus]